MYFQCFIKIIKYFGKGKILKLLTFIIMSLIAGALEFVGITLIYPLVILLINPNVASTYSDKLPVILQNVSPTIMALSFGLIAMTIFIGKNLYMMFFMYVQNKFLGNWILRINYMLMDFFVNAPFNLIQKISNAEKLYILDVLIPISINNYVNRILTLYANIIILLSIIGLVLYKFFMAGIITIIFALICILLQNYIFRKKIKDIASKTIPITRLLNNVSYSMVNCIKEIKIMGAETEFNSKYKKVVRDATNLNVSQTTLNSISPYLVEIFIVLSIIILMLFIVLEKSSSGDVMVASFAVIVASIFRIAPILNKVQSGIINLPSNYKYAKELTEFYEKYEFIYFNYPIQETEAIIDFNNRIELKNVNFSYEENKPILNDISFTINKGDFIGIIGLSGAGKTTLADVLTGLLPVDSGEISVDGICLNRDNFRAFRKNIGYVPQETEILECSIRENVAWGIEPNEIDDEKVTQLLKDVHLWDLVSSYEQGIYAEPIIGDNGLSGGQKQRLAIARALYRNPSILLFDEATSSLDVKTEHDITSMIKSIGSDRTVIAIAHRLSTLKACNRLIYMKDGHIIDIGTFDELSSKYSEFAELIRLSNLQPKDHNDE